jgi:hypothetical protein
MNQTDRVPKKTTRITVTTQMLHYSHIHLRLIWSEDNCQVQHTAGFISSLVIPLANKQNTAPPYQETFDSRQHVHVALCSCYYSVGEEDKSVLSDRFNNRTSPVTDESEIFLFLLIITQIEHDIRGNVQEYWPATEQFLTTFTARVTCDRITHSLNISTCQSKRHRHLPQL